MKKTMLSLLLITPLLFTGCASPDYRGVDILTFLPGGSTYKHVQRSQMEFRQEQLADLSDNFDSVRPIDENAVMVSHDGEYTTVGIDVLRFGEALNRDGGWGAVIFDVLKTALYTGGIYALSEGGGGRRGGSPDAETSSGGDSTIIQIQGSDNFVEVSGSPPPPLEFE